MPMPGCDPCCANPECTNCLGGFGPKRWKVVVAGITSRGPCGGGGSPDCTDLNGTFYLDHLYDTSQCCRWGFDIGAWLCPPGSFDNSIILDVCNDNTIRVLWTGPTTTDPCPCVYFSKQYPSLPDCRHIANDVLAILNAANFNYGCDFSDATVTISAAA